MALRLNLSRPYPAGDVAARWKQAALFGLFVFVFLFLFQPFGLSSYEGSLLRLTLGYGLTCFVMMVVLNLLLVPLLPGWFAEDKWTAGRQIAWTMVNIAMIGAANLAYSRLTGIAPLSLRHLLVFESFTVAVGFFPVVISVLLTGFRLENRYEKASAELSGRLEPARPDKETVQLSGEGETGQLLLHRDQLLFIRGADNYAEVFYTEGGMLRRKLIRNSLKNILASVNHPSLFRCHRSYLVNLGNVKKVSGNAQGYKLHFEGGTDPVPVSRSVNGVVRDKLLSSRSL